MAGYCLISPFCSTVGIALDFTSCPAMIKCPIRSSPPSSRPSRSWA
jgi:hypothetical protein